MVLNIGISSTVLSNVRRRSYIDGIGNYTATLMESLKKLNCEVTPVTYTPLTQKHKTINPILPNGKAFSYPEHLEVFFSFFLDNFNHKLEKHLSIYHSTDYSCPKFKNIPVVSTLHDAILLKNRQLLQNPFTKINRLALKRKLQHNSDHFIAISKEIVPDLVEYWGIKPEQIDVVHNGISDWWWENVSEKERQFIKNKWHLKKKFILFVSTLRPRKNLLRLIQAYKCLPLELRQENQLIVVGQNPGNADLIINELKKLSEKGECIWLNYISKEELRVLYQCASLFVFPSLAEGFGLPIVEAFASKVPVITSNFGSMAEIAENAALLVDPYDVEQLSHAMALLLTDRKLANQYIEKAERRALNFTASEQAKKIFAVYQKLLS